MIDNKNIKAIIDVLDEVEPYLDYLLQFIKETRILVEEAGDDASRWSSLIPVINDRCKKAIPYAKINLGRFLLHLNARCSNMSLILEDTPENQVPFKPG